MSSTPPNDEVFLAQTEMDANPKATARLYTVQTGMRYDMNLYGLWIKKSSTAHSLANILGLRLEDPSKSWTKNPNPNANKTV
jgi:hypothetical protein